VQHCTAISAIASSVDEIQLKYVIAVAAGDGDVFQVNGPMIGAVVPVIITMRTATSTWVSGRITYVMVRAGTCMPAQGCSTKDNGVTASVPGRVKSAVLEVSCLLSRHM